MFNLKYFFTEWTKSTNAVGEIPFHPGGSAALLLLFYLDSCPELSCKLEIRNTALWTLIWANLGEEIVTYSLISLICDFNQ